MTRKRSDPSLRWLPSRVYVTPSGAYSLHPREGGAKIIAKRGSSPAQVWEAYNSHIARQRDSGLLYLWENYQASSRWAELSQATRVDYTQASKVPLAFFAAVDCRQLRQPDIRLYLDARSKKARVRANRELSWLTVVFAWAFERGLMPMNPAIGVRPNKERPRKHYADKTAYEALRSIAPPVVRVAMEIAYCTGLRQADILALRWNQITDKGMVVVQQKTGDAIDKALSDRLRAALETARSLPGTASVFVLHNRDGARYTRSGFNSIWQRYQRKLPAHHRFTFHDLRRTAVTDAGGSKEFSGHRSDAMARRYVALPIKSPSH